ncbi:MAG TPA: lipid-A-disaccharide synthase [Bryobacteraceae bacterium]|nr:lipid-A-disaccharide synthase [Bryobacteraceae bacterium]
MARILVSAGEASGDLYASHLVEAVRRRRPDLTFAGCAGPRMRAAGVEQVVDQAQLNVVGLFEVIHHIPRIWGEYRKLVRWARENRPEAAILTDSPDFHLRLARQLKKLGIPVIYLVAPQAWAWRKGRIPAMRRMIDKLLCILPFEEAFFRSHGVNASYIGHPLTRIVRGSAPPGELRRDFGIGSGKKAIALLPGSRPGEALRHMPHIVEAAERIHAARPETQFLLALPSGFTSRADLTSFRERFSRASVQVIEGRTWDVLACADLALAASGTVTVEAALLGLPMVTFYRVAWLSWTLGRPLVRVPFYTMVNLIAGRRVVPEIMQGEASGQRLAAEVLALLEDGAALETMRTGIAEVSLKLSGATDPMDAAADIVESYLHKEPVHVP